MDDQRYAYGSPRTSAGERASEVVRDADRARYRLARIGDRASAPSADLVAKQSEPSGPSCPDRTLGDDATLSSPLVPDRRGLDDEAAVGGVDLQGGMVESTARATLYQGFDRLVDPSHSIGPLGRPRPKGSSRGRPLRARAWTTSLHPTNGAQRDAGSASGSVRCGLARRREPRPRSPRRAAKAV